MLRSQDIHSPSTQRGARHASGARTFVDHERQEECERERECESEPDRDASLGAPLLSVRGLHETVAAGYGNAMLVVRTLDDVSLSVHRGDLVLVSGAAGGGAASLVATLAGRRRVSHGSRDLSPGARVRRGVVSPAARDAIVAGWMAPPEWPVLPWQAGGVRTAYLLRVRQPSARAERATEDSSHATPIARGEHGPAEQPIAESWMVWARALRQAGGAIVLWEAGAARSAVHADVATRLEMLRSTGSNGIRARGERVRESPVEQDGATERSPQAGRVRMLTLVAGRIAADRILVRGGR